MNTNNTMTMKTGVGLKRKDIVRPIGTPEVESELLNNWAKEFNQAGPGLMNTFEYEGRKTVIEIVKEVKRAINYYRFSWRGGIYVAEEGCNVRFFITRLRHAGGVCGRMNLDSVEGNVDEAESVVNATYHLYTIKTEGAVIVLHLYFNAPTKDDIKKFLKDFKEVPDLLSSIYNRNTALQYSSLLNLLQGANADKIIHSIAVGYVNDHEFAYDDMAVDVKLGMNIDFYAQNYNPEHVVVTDFIKLMDFVEAKELEYTGRCTRCTGGDVGAIHTMLRMSTGDYIVVTIKYSLNSIMEKELERCNDEFIEKLVKQLAVDGITLV